MEIILLSGGSANQIILACANQSNYEKAFYVIDTVNHKVPRSLDPIALQILINKNVAFVCINHLPKLFSKIILRSLRSFLRVTSNPHQINADHHLLTSNLRAFFSRNEINYDPSPREPFALLHLRGMDYVGTAYDIFNDSFFQHVTAIAAGMSLPLFAVTDDENHFAVAAEHWGIEIIPTGKATDVIHLAKMAKTFIGCNSTLSFVACAYRNYEDCYLPIDWGILRFDDSSLFTRKITYF